MAKLPKIGSELSLTEQAYMAIKDAIINNTLTPNEILTEEALAAQLGISRTPIRAALEKLAVQRLVKMKRGKNAVVAHISESDLRKVFDIREALDPVVIRVAAKNMTEKRCSELEKIILEQETAVNENDFELYIHKDYEFHTALSKFTDNEQLHEIMVSISSQVIRFMILSTSLQKSSYPALGEHREILDALKKRDAALAEKKMVEHGLNVVNRILG